MTQENPSKSGLSDGSGAEPSQSGPDAARAIVIRGEQLLIMRRNKHGVKYMVTPGGRIEAGEELEETVIREVAEETTIKITNPQLVFVEEPNDSRWGTQYIYLCQYVSGEPILPADSQEFEIQQNEESYYSPGWINFDEFPDPEYPFMSKRLGDEIARALREGFPKEPKRWTLINV